MTQCRLTRHCVNGERKGIALKFLKKLDKILEYLEGWILVITGTAVGVMILVNAIFRFLRVDWFGSEELTMFVAFWLYFVGAACASRDGTHISADMVTLFTENPRTRAIVALVKNAISLAMSAVFTVWCFNYVAWQASLGAKSSVYKLPVIISTIPILICFALWTLYLLRDLVMNVKTIRNGSNAQKEGGN